MILPKPSSRFKLVIFAVLFLSLSISLNSCGAGPIEEQYSNNSEDENPSFSQNTNDQSPWLTTEGQTSDGYTATCDFNGDESQGTLVLCDIYWDAKNISTQPQEYFGYTYLIVDGSIYQTEDNYADLRSVNPGSYAVKKGGFNSFRIPYGGTITGLFKSDTPDGIHLLDLDLSIEITN